MNKSTFLQKKLKDVCLLIGDGTHFSPQSTSGPYKYITSKNIRFGKLDLSEVSYISEQDHKVIYKSSPVKYGDILLTKDGANTGNACINKINEEFSLLSSVAYLRVDEKKADTQYVLQQLLSNDVQWTIRNMMSGQAITRLTLTKIKDIPISLPELLEQKKIAQILSTWDEAIEAVEELIKKKEKLKGILLHTLVIGKKKTAEFKNSKWITKSLSELGDIVSGGTPDTTQKEYWDGQIAWCTPTDITALKGKRQIAQTNRTITEKGLRKSSARLLPENSIIVCTRATIGDVAMNTIPMATNQGFKSLVPYKENDGNYLYYLVLTLKKRFTRLSSGSTFLELSKRDFAKTSVTLPQEIEEQKKISKIMLDIDEGIELLKIKRSLLVRQKKGLMQRLLTGKVRVS